MCEAGFTRAKNTGNILMKNLMDFCIGTPVYWLLGFGLMFGAGSGALIGGLDPMIPGDYSAILPAGVPLWAYRHLPDRVLRHLRHHRLRRHGRAHQVHAYCIYSAAISAADLPDLRPLDLGRRLAQ